MKFADGEAGKMAAEFNSLHPTIQHLMLAFERWSIDQSKADPSFPMPVITDIYRDKFSQTQIYVKYWTNLVSQYQTKPESVPKKEGHLARLLSMLPPGGIVKRAQGKFTWHNVYCACDIRTRHYTDAQLNKVWLWFHKEIGNQPSEFECLLHAVEGPPHLHVAIKDDSYKVRYLAGNV